jgi:hypothetical protein
MSYTLTSNTSIMFSTTTATTSVTAYTTSATKSVMSSTTTATTSVTAYTTTATTSVISSNIHRYHLCNVLHHYRYNFYNCLTTTPLPHL